MEPQCAGASARGAVVHLAAEGEAVDGPCHSTGMLHVRMLFESIHGNLVHLSDLNVNSPQVCSGES